VSLIVIYYNIFDGLALGCVIQNAWINKLLSLTFSFVYFILFLFLFILQGDNGPHWTCSFVLLVFYLWDNIIMFMFKFS